MFKGQATPKLDDKNRLTLPAKYRRELGDEITVVCERERCLGVYRRDVFEAMMQQDAEGPSTFRRIRDYQRWMSSRAEDVTPDGQGRVTLTPQQLTWAEFDREVIVIGSGNRLEVWNPEQWLEYETALDTEFTNFDGRIAPDS
jgi:MraZ protein